MIYRSAINSMLLARQGFLKPFNIYDYDRLFRSLSPVQPVYWSYPGMAPCFFYRTDFDNLSYNYDLRFRREIIKGRFQKGNVGYILADELELFAAVYRRENDVMGFNEGEVYELLQREGPMDIAAIKEFTGFLSKDITPLLHKLQKKFLVYEDQYDDSDRAWYILNDIFPGVSIDQYTKIDALKILISRFVYMNVFINEDMLKSFYGITLKEIKPPLANLLDEGILLEERTDRGNGYILKDDYPLLKADNPPKKSVFVLHRNDFLVKSNEGFLNERFKNIRENIIYYVLIDGEFQGAVIGRYRNGPFELHDFVAADPQLNLRHRREEILAALYKISDQTASPLEKFLGEKI